MYGALIGLATSALVGAAPPAELALPPVITATTTREDEALSLELEPPEETWRETGFRLGLGYAADAVFGGGGTPGGLHHSAVLRLGVRLDPGWSLLGTLRYGARFGLNGGMRYSGTVEPTLHVFDATTISVGAGIGGLVIPATGALTPSPELVASLTLPGTKPLLGACSGAGVTGLVRLEHLFLTSQSFAHGPALQADVQWTPCTQRLGRTDPDTGESIELRQLWWSYGVSLGWLAWWR